MQRGRQLILQYPLELSTPIMVIRFSEVKVASLVNITEHRALAPPAIPTMEEAKLASKTTFLLTPSFNNSLLSALPQLLFELLFTPVLGSIAIAEPSRVSATFVFTTYSQVSGFYWLVRWSGNFSHI